MRNVRKSFFGIGIGICVCVLALALGACATKPEGAAEQGDAQTAPEQSAADKAQDATDKTQSEATEAKPVDGDRHAGDAQGSGTAKAADEGNTVDEATLDTWSKKARSFITIYPANYVHAGGESDELLSMTVEDWANNCLSYIDPESTLGKQLASDPEAVATPLGFHDVASVVESCEVTGANVGGVNVSVTMKVTQMSWEAADTHTRSYLVQFNNDNLITNVVDTH